MDILDMEHQGRIDLIAAAPELLYALELAIDILRFSCDVHPDSCADYMDALQTGAVAIANAKGRA